MIVSEHSAFGSAKKPIGYKVAGLSKTKIRSISDQLQKLPDVAGCYKQDGYFIDTLQLLENVLFKAEYYAHPVDDGTLTETAAFTVSNLIVMQDSIYEGLFKNDPFSRYTIVHEFSHIVLNHSVTLHRGAMLGEHGWFEDSEWQANNLAAELMMPVATVKRLNCSAQAIMDRCGVSAKAAQFRLDNLQKERLIN